MNTTALSNDLRVVTVARPVGLAAIYLWINAGSADEHPNEHGAAHFLEHMLFKGTARRGIGRAAAEIEALGGDLNAFTTHEATVLHATVLASGWGEALDVLADMARNSQIDPSEVERERQVIVEEIRGYESQAEELLHEAIDAACFPEHPYGRPIAGTADEARALTPAGLRTFWEREWGADRAILVVVGEVDHEQVVEAATRLFGTWQRAAPRAPLGEPPAIGPSAEPVIVPVGGRRSRLVQLAFRTVPLDHPDAPALDLLALILGDGPGALIPERLADEELLADPWASAAHRRAGGTLTLGFQPRGADAGVAVERVLAALAELRVEGLPADAVERTRAGLLSDFVFSAETVDGLAYDLAAHEAWYGGAATRAVQRERYARVGHDDLDRVLRSWLRSEHLVVAAHDPALPEAGLRPSIRRGLRATPPSPFRPLDTRLDNGARLIVAPDPGDVVAVTLAFPGGLATVPAHLGGLAEAWAGMVTAGADGMSAGRFSACVDATGGMIWGAAGRETFEIHGRFPRQTAAEGLALALMALSSPEWDPDVWDRQRDELLQDVESVHEDAASLAARQLWRLSWPGHPWSLSSVGTRTSVNRLNPSKIGDLHERLAAGRQVAVAVTGAIPTDRVERIVHQWLADLPADARRVRLGRFPSESANPHQHRTGQCEQAYVTIGGRGLTLDDPDRAALHVLIGWLSAQSGPLFLTLRERLGLAYDVGADSVEGVAGGLVQAGLATDPSRLDEAIEALGRCLDDAITTPPSEQLVAQTVATLKGARARALQQAGRRAARLARAAALGRDPHHDPLPQAWAAVRPGDLRRVGERLFGPDRWVVTARPRT